MPLLDHGYPSQLRVKNCHVLLVYFFPSLLLHINKAEEVNNSSILIGLWILSNNMRFYI